MRRFGIVALCAAAAIGLAAPSFAQRAHMEQVPARQPGEGEGPYSKLVIRGATMIKGDGSPPLGPVDIVIEGNRIAAVEPAGTPGVPMRPNRPPRDAVKEIDATGMWVMPGFIDVHGHNGDPEKAPNASYGYKLWLAHGVTTVRGVPFYFGDVAQTLSDRARSANNTIVAPRLVTYAVLGDAWPNGDADTPEKAREWVRWAAKTGFDGVKFFNMQPPEATRAAIDEARKLHMGTIAHLSQPGVARFNALDAGRAGLGTVTHFYGHFEALLKDHRVQTVASDYNYQNEQSRFGDFADLADQIVEPGGPEWNAYLREQLSHGVVFNPTFNIYSASRDLMRARNADWNAKHVLPSLMNYYAANRENHGSYWYDWTTTREIKWRRFYVPYMKLMNDYKNMGGLVTAGSDPGFIYQTWGFSYIGELEMLQEAGFSPLEVIEAATWNGAQELYKPKGIEPPIGLVEPGKLADLIIAPENPLQNLKTLYGTGFDRLEADGKIHHVGGIKYVIKDGIVYDAHQLLDEIAAMVQAQKAGQAH
ncbi:MAG TPA: amidohydrolase family protein [Sphingomicrobium sp.]|nr:amidohydrolase family protein [Sphingomicrobium sp.]